MFSRLALVVALALGSAALLAAQQSDSPEPYNDDEAYRVYDVLLPHDSSPNTLVIQQETIGPLSREGSASLGPENCLTPAAASEFKDAILDYNRNNQKKSLLQRKFSVSRPYEILDAGTLNAMFQHPDGWNLPALPEFRRHLQHVGRGLQPRQDASPGLLRVRLPGAVW